MNNNYILGTEHSSKESKNRIQYIFHNYKFNSILLEGVGGIKLLKPRDWFREPFLISTVHLYFWALKAKGSELDLAKSLANQYKITCINMDLNMTQLIDYFHKWYNYILFFFLFSSLWYISKLGAQGPLLFLNNPIYKLLWSFLFANIFYFIYFVFKTKAIRDAQFTNKIQLYLKDNKDDGILVICGKLHRKNIIKKFKIIDLTKEKLK